MSLVNIINARLNYGDDLLLDGAELAIEEHERICFSWP